MTRAITLTLALLPLIAAQQIGQAPEVHPKLTTFKCTTRDGCVKQETSIVIDAATHQIHEKGTETSCTDAEGNLDTTICPDKETCAEKCVVEGIKDYASLGVKTDGDSLSLRQYVSDGGELTSASPRVYLLDPTGDNYSMLQLLNQEFTFDVDVSNLPCGMNGALYLSEMAASGGRSELNAAGAHYGTGYCDAQCFTTAWVNGEGNVDGVGSCCNEMDIWEANARATGFTPHPCDTEGLVECEGEEECGDAGICDKIGCGFNPYALGAQDYYGYNMTVNSKKPFTVVTQFVTKGNQTEGGERAEIRRQYVQDGRVISNAVVTVDDGEADSITDGLCPDTESAYQRLGGLKQMGGALGRGMVLAMSIWNDESTFMNWLDSGDAGPCDPKEGDPALIEKQVPDTAVTFSNIRWGDIGSTTTTKKSSYRHRYQGRVRHHY